MTVRTLCVRRSQNEKTGPVALAVYRTQESCPRDCIFRGSGCYGENVGARLFRFAERGDDDMLELSTQIGLLHPGDVIRLNVVGDYLTAEGGPDHTYIDVTNRIPTGVDVLSYTHAWRRLDPGMFMPHTRPSASCDTVSSVREALAAGWKAVVVDSDGSIPRLTIDGERAISCLFETNGRQCVDCRLCARGKRSSVPVFQVHGSGKKHARRAIDEQRALEARA
jgi:hypothetical protein